MVESNRNVMTERSGLLSDPTRRRRRRRRKERRRRRTCRYSIFTKLESHAGKVGRLGART
jgi:hypothetical protein